MIRLLHIPLLLALSVGAQLVTPFFRPDSVSVVTGRVLCGNSGASGIVVEWWADRGQLVDVKLGSAVTDFQGNFRVQRNSFSHSKTYLYISNTCGTGGIRQNSRFEVNLGNPSNLLLQLNQHSGADPGSTQISGRVTCQGRPVPFSVVEWWSNQGFGPDRQLGTTITDVNGSFRASNQNANGRTYLVVKHNCRGASSRNSRFDINLNAAQNMLLELVRGSGNGNNNGISQIAGRLYCNGRRLGNVLVEWFVRSRGNDQFIGSTRAFGDGSFSIRSNRFVDSDDSYIRVSHSCNSRRQRTDRFDVDRRRPTNMDVDVRRDRSRSSDSDSGSNERGSRPGRRDRALDDTEMSTESLPIESVDDRVPDGIAVEPPRMTSETVGDRLPEGLAVQPTSSVVLFPTSVEETNLETGVNAVKIPLDGTQKLTVKLSSSEESEETKETSKESALPVVKHHA